MEVGHVKSLVSFWQNLLHAKDACTAALASYAMVWREAAAAEEWPVEEGGRGCMDSPTSLTTPILRGPWSRVGVTLRGSTSDQPSLSLPEQQQGKAGGAR